MPPIPTLLVSSDSVRDKFLDTVTLFSCFFSEKRRDLKSLSAFSVLHLSILLSSHPPEKVDFRAE